MKRATISNEKRGVEVLGKTVVGSGQEESEKTAFPTRRTKKEAFELQAENKERSGGNSARTTDTKGIRQRGKGPRKLWHGPLGKVTKSQESRREKPLELETPGEKGQNLR